MTSNIALSSDTVRGNYVLLTADALQLLLPQHDVGAAEYLSGTPEPSRQFGVFSGENGRRYAALSSEMKLLGQYPAGRFLATSIGEQDDLFWCWNELRVMIDAELEICALPPVLCAPDTPVRQYAEIDGKLAYLCTAEQMRVLSLTSKD